MKRGSTALPRVARSEKHERTGNLRSARGTVQAISCPKLQDEGLAKICLLYWGAFDILWDEHAKSDDEEETRRFRNGEDTRYLPLVDRQQRLRRVVRNGGAAPLYCDHVDGHGEALFRLACQQDLEGSVAKHNSHPYLPEHANWLKIRNREYSQWAG